jgi:hypothetical protein
VLDVKQREQLANLRLLGGVVGVQGGGNTKREDEKKSGTLHGNLWGEDGKSGVMFCVRYITCVSE